MAKLARDEDLISRMEYYEFGFENALKRKGRKYFQTS